MNMRPILVKHRRRSTAQLDALEVLTKRMLDLELAVSCILEILASIRLSLLDVTWGQP